ncbi:MAG: hypothetical protein L0Y44_14815, partial [Phycisphaerales bacterium]|nr:hypothetical protein [Phycisphaerales bacterium]MCI0676444.1 hypothetical protein [Phycisphaerales bacterium]
MSRRARRIIIPLLAAAVCAGILWVVFNAPNRRGSGGAAPSGASATQPATQSAQPGAATTAPHPSAIDSPALTQFTSLRAVAPAGASQALPEPLGSLDFRRATMQLDLTRVGAGIARIAYSDIWETAEANRIADAYRKRLGPADPFDLTQVDESQRYVLQQEQPFVWSNGSTLIPILAAHSVVINGSLVSLFEGSIWSETAVGRFETTIVDQDGKPVAQIVRQHILKPGYGLVIVQQVENVSGQPLEVKWQQYGPLDLRTDQSGYNLDRRRFAFGYLAYPGVPGRETALYGEDDFDLERGQAMKRHNKAVDTP